MGGAFRLNGERIHARLPSEAAHLLVELKAHREEVILFLQSREKIPSMPPGARLMRWEPKSVPIILTNYIVVTDVHRFIYMTLLELAAALAGKRWQCGHWSVRDLLDRLEQCGVQVEVESAKRQ